MESQPAADEAVQPQSRQQSAFPPPPPYYRLFRGLRDPVTPAAARKGADFDTAAGNTEPHDGDTPRASNRSGPSNAAGEEATTEGGAESTLDGRSAALSSFPLQPPPLPGDGATFQVFGELHTTKPGIAPLAVKQLYEASANGTIDFPKELRRLNRELLFAFANMLSSVASRPSQSARSVETVGALIRNIQHLLNLLRPHQAAATLEHILTVELEEQRAAITDLKTHTQRSRQLLLSAAQALTETGQQEQELPSSGASPMEMDDSTL